MTYVEFSHPRVYLRLCRVAGTLRSRRCAPRRLIFLQGGSLGRTVPTKQQRASPVRARALGAAYGVLHGSELGLRLGARRQAGHRGGGARQRLRWRRKGRVLAAARGLAVPDVVHWRACRCRRCVRRGVARRPLAAHKVSAAGPPDRQVHSVVAIAVPAGMHGRGVPVLLVRGIMLSIIM